jgi:hypothetical protein
MQMPNWTTEDLTPCCLNHNSLEAVFSKTPLASARAVAYERAALLASLGLTPEAIMAFLVCRNANLHSTSSASVIRRLAYLHDELCIPRDRLCVLVANNTRMLDYSVERRYKPHVRFFMRYFQMGAADIGKLVLRNPRLLMVRFLSRLSRCARGSHRSVAGRELASACACASGRVQEAVLRTPQARGTVGRVNRSENPGCHRHHANYGVP